LRTKEHVAAEIARRVEEYTKVLKRRESASWMRGIEDATGGEEPR
jgi:hypothetical protein